MQASKHMPWSGGWFGVEAEPTPNRAGAEGHESGVTSPTVMSGFQLVAGRVTDVEDMNGVLANGEDDSMLMLLRPAMEQFADLLGELMALGGDRAAEGAGFQ
jgi:hypothetical protein